MTTLHPDVLTDLVILYHAGEASQASRDLLEKEATQNPALAAALAAHPRTLPPMAAPVLHERETLRRVARHYRVRFLLAVSLALALIAAFTILRTAGWGAGSSRGIPTAPAAR